MSSSAQLRFRSSKSLDPSCYAVAKGLDLNATWRSKWVEEDVGSEGLNRDTECGTFLRGF